MAAANIQQPYTLLLVFVVFISFFHFQSYVALGHRLKSNKGLSGVLPAHRSKAYKGLAATPHSHGHQMKAYRLRGMALLEETCRHTQFYDLCLSLLLSDPRSTRTTDLRGLLRITLDMAMTNASHILGYIHDILRIYRSVSSTPGNNSNSNNTNTNNNNNTISANTFNVTSFESCGQEYDDSLTNLQWAIEAVFDGIAGEDYHDANNFMNEAITSTDRCKREMFEGGRERGELSKPLTDMNDNMSRLLQISQDILCYLSPDSCRH